MTLRESASQSGNLCLCRHGFDAESNVAMLTSLLFALQKRDHPALTIGCAHQPGGGEQAREPTTTVAGQIEEPLRVDPCAPSVLQPYEACCTEPDFCVPGRTPCFPSRKKHWKQEVSHKGHLREDQECTPSACRSLRVLMSGRRNPPARYPLPLPAGAQSTICAVAGMRTSMTWPQLPACGLCTVDPCLTVQGMASPAAPSSTRAAHTYASCCGFLP